MTEKIPKINWENQVVGETTIKEAIKNDWPRRIARVFVFNASGQMLLQLRSDNALSFPSLWDQSAGGHVDVGETTEEAAKRELHEEVGIQTELKLVVEGVRSSCKEDRVFSYVYRADVPDDINIKFDPVELQSVRWISVADFDKEVKELPENFVPTFVGIFNDHRNKIIPLTTKI